MTREQLKECDGWTVQIEANGMESLAILHSSDVENAYLNPVEGGDWAVAGRYTLSDEDVERMSINGSRNIFSLIKLKRVLGRASE